MIRHVKRQENTTHNEENNQSMEINPDLTQTLALVKKYELLLFYSICPKS